jgi:hypothetical protein
VVGLCIINAGMFELLFYAILTLHSQVRGIAPFENEPFNFFFAVGVLCIVF